MRMLVLVLGTDSFPIVPDIRIKYKAGTIIGFIYYQQIIWKDKKNNNVFTQLTSFMCSQSTITHKTYQTHIN